MSKVSVSSRVLIVASVFLFIMAKVSFSQEDKEIKNVLYLNSYALNYTWADSLVSGIQEIFIKRRDIHLYIEFLDAQRFGKTTFQRALQLYLEKYQNIRFDAVITSDNDALDFMMLYGDTLAPGVPVSFCGINNPQDYHFDNSRFYGILDVVDLKTEINLIMRVMPSVKKLYFITDRSTTSLLNLRYARELEQEYTGRLQFEYVHNYSVDDLMVAVSKFEKGGAVALMNYYQDNQGHVVNPNEIYKEIAERTPVPIFMDSESMLGRGIAGGIINNGAAHGREVALLALKFIDQPGFIPDQRVTLPKSNYYFDYKVLDKHKISLSSLPAGSFVINIPQTNAKKYIKFIVLLTGIIGFLLLVVLQLYLSSQKRKRAESLVNTKLIEIQEKNKLLEQAHRQLNKMNTELAEMNESLTRTNTALVIAKEKSEESDKLKSAFLTNISHEIRTPLNAIIGFSALLNDADLSCEERCEYFGIINSNSDQLLRIIDDVLDLSKIEAGQLKLHIESFFVHEFLNEIADSYRQVVNRNHVQLVVSESDIQHQLIMKSDRARFKQIFGNLLSNAVKFTHRGSIEIGYSFIGNKEITFYVKDTGIGIHPKELRLLFSRFWKANAQGERFYSGAGLGLAISKKLCEAMGGKIRVESEYGVGTTFYLTFQDYIVKSQPKNQPVYTSLPKNALNLEGFVVAIAEDENANMYLRSKFLRETQCEVLMFKTGKEIIDYFNTHSRNVKVDLILMDIKMPDMDGITASAIIKNKHPEIPIIAQTAYATAEDVINIKDTAIDDYVSKPIKTSILAEKIRKLLYPEKAGQRLNY